jgi:lysophospholipase
MANSALGSVPTDRNGCPSRLASFEEYVFTSGEVRFARVARLVAACPDLRLGGPTIGWTHASFCQMSRLDNSRFPRSKLNSILVVAAGADRVTDTSATIRLASRLGAALVVIDGAQHEILIERDVLRAKFCAAFDEFVAGSASNPSLLQ